jgi:hypothetical protein
MVDLFQLIEVVSIAKLWSHGFSCNSFGCETSIDIKEEKFENEIILEGIIDKVREIDMRKDANLK